MGDKYVFRDCIERAVREIRETGSQVHSWCTPATVSNYSESDFVDCLAPEKLARLTGLVTSFRNVAGRAAENVPLSKDEVSQAQDLICEIAELISLCD